jgi:UDP-glucose 4-epimerase
VRTLIVGGLNGFVGSNTTEALVNLGRDCVVTRHKRTEIPQFLQPHIDQKRVIIEEADATSIDDLRKIGEKHQIDSIVNVGGGFGVGPKSPTYRLEGYFDMLTAIFKLAQEWKVKRITFSSTGGMYLGHQGTAVETLPVVLQIPIRGGSIVSYQKIVEVASNEFEQASGISTICVRLMGMYGPFQDPSQGFASPALTLVHAAVNGKTPDLSKAIFGYADDSVDMLYIKDLARAIAMLHTAEKLQYNVYNIASGKHTPTKELAEAVQNAVPGFHVNLPPGRFPFPPLPVVDTTRLRADTGFIPKFDIQSGVQDYISWLKAGNPK